MKNKKPKTTCTQSGSFYVAIGGRYRTRPKAQPQGKRSATERYVISLSGIGNAAQTQHKKQQKRKGVLPFLILVRHKASLCQWWTIQDSSQGAAAG